jgi:hypothetical protein
VAGDGQDADLSTVRDIWRGLPTDKTVYLRWWFVPVAEIPRDEAEQTDWLYKWWETIDGWIATTGQGSPQVGNDRRS